MKNRALHKFILASSCAAIAVAPSTTFASGVNKMVSDVCKTSTDAAFRDKYCKAAKDTKKGYVANRATAAIWGGVSAVCLTACGNALGGLVCKSANMGGSAGESIVTKSFTSSLVSEGTTTVKSVDSAGQAAAASESKLNGDACTTAGRTALKSFEKIANSKQNTRSLEELRAQTKGMNTTGEDAAPAFASTDSKNLGGEDSDAKAPTTVMEICDERALGSAAGSIRCAASVDPTLPPYVKSEQFVRDLEKATGKSADDFFAGFESPTKTLFDAPAMKNFSEGAQQGAATALAAMERTAEHSMERRNAAKTPNEKGDRDSASRRSAFSEDEDSGFDVNSAIASALGSLNGEKAEENASGVESVVAGRAPAADDRTISPEDRKISLFDRVQWRYGIVTTRDHLGLETEKKGNAR